MDFEWIKLGYKLLFDSKARFHLLGYRPDVICFVKSTDAESKYLLIVPEQDHSIWIPPQEGIEINETIEMAALRCLKTELGLANEQVYFRRSFWAGNRRLPQSRWGERDLPHSIRGWLGKEHMIGKAYYGASIVVSGGATINPTPTEVYKSEWVSKDEFLDRIKSNDPTKAEILLNACKRIYGWTINQ
jgi:hypothetical protein